MIERGCFLVLTVLLAFGLLAFGCGAVEVIATDVNEVDKGDERAKDELAPSTDMTQALAVAAGQESIRIERKRLTNGLPQLHIQAKKGELARITLVIQASDLHDPKGKAGIARLTAHCLRESGSGGLGSESIDASLERIDAKLELAFRGTQLYFEGLCPEEQLPELARVLFNLVNQDAPSNQVIAAQRSRLLVELDAAPEVYKQRWQLFQSLGRSLPTPSRLRRELAGIGSAEVILFYSKHYRPQNALLAVQTRSNESLQIVQEIFEHWPAGDRLQPLAREGRLTRSSYDLTPGKEAHVLLLLRDPDPTLSGSGRQEVAWQLLCMDGNGGVFARKLAAKGIGDLGFVRGSIDTGRRKLRTLSARLRPTRVIDVLQAFDDALRELSTKIVSRAEFRMARKRAAFLWNARLNRPASRIRCFIDAELAGQRNGLDRKTLESIAELDENSILSKSQAPLRAISIVRGAKPAGATLLPQPSQSMQSPDVSAKVQPLGLAAKDRLRIARETIELAIETLGGKKQLLGLTEFGFRSKIETMASIPYTEVWQLRLPDGPFVRTRKILGTGIVNRTAGDKVLESYGGKTDTLERAEARLFRLEAHLHPTMMLSYILQLKSKPVLIGRLESGDRKLLILEFQAFDQKLRIAIDEENGLVRRLSYAEWRPDTAPQEITLLFQDYRSKHGLKLPHRVLKFVDGERRSEMSLEY